MVPTQASTPTRRDVLRGVAVATTAGVVSGSPAAAQDGSGATQTVEMTDELVFDPDDLTVAPGDTVEWQNVGEVEHTVTAYEDALPEGADYFASGDFDSESAARSGYPEGAIAGGESYSHTFDTEGEYQYFCVPHESTGMVGLVAVVAGGAPPEPAAPLPSVPDAAKSLALAAVMSMLSVLGLTYVFLKYGGDYEGQDEVPPPGGRPG